MITAHRRLLWYHDSRFIVLLLLGGKKREEYVKVKQYVDTYIRGTLFQQIESTNQ